MKSRSHLYLGSLFWDGLWIIQQPVCREISRQEPVLYVERFVSLFTVLRYPHLWKRLFMWLYGARSMGPKLRVLAPLPLWHLGHRWPWLFRMEFEIQRLWILLWAHLGARGDRILWVDNPLYECAVGRMGEGHSVYHIADEVSAFPTSHPRTVERLERMLLNKVDLCFAAAERLGAEKRRWHPRVFTIWNAIDARIFQATNVKNSAFPELDELSGPKVAFVGVLDEWVDIDLLATVAQRLRHVHFLVVGPSHVNDGVLRERPNVHLLGRRDRSAIPTLLRQCSASLVPFKKNRLTERILPLKVFEALAAGATPVCTAFSPDLQTLAQKGLVMVGDSAEEFARAVERAIGNDAPPYRQRLEEYGLAQTWEARWVEMTGILESSFNQVGSAGTSRVSAQASPDTSTVQH